MSIEDVTIDEVMRSIGKDKQPKVMMLEEGSTVRDAFNILGAQGCLSAPVTGIEGIFRGIVDVQDLLSVVVTACGDSVPTGSALSALLDKTLVGLTEGRDVGFLPAGLSRKRKLRDVVHDVFNRLRVHRLFINDCDAEVTGIFTQSDVLKFLARSADAVPKTTLAEVELASKPVISVPEEATALSAFIKMAEQRLHLAAVVGADGVLTGVISSSDLRGMAESDFPLLEKPVNEFRKAPKSHHSPSPPDAISFPSSTSLTDVITRLAATGAHGGFVVDEAGRPVGVLTLTDLLVYLFP
eukprot:NODE_906_length_1242_cov_208.969824_g691_i0.p2 GENE.NODE_906_length_1242_cov_208.969824_g691_i0~~NODE_906_length_1242_cov_208.969824_g691_i0.p2  ORF type:complete len:297 (+),score=82.46 NODE_906_length_1242_cov_208.969824_g691_i0:212-1102(+)